MNTNESVPPPPTLYTSGGPLVSRGQFPPRERKGEVGAALDPIRAGEGATSTDGGGGGATSSLLPPPPRWAYHRGHRERERESGGYQDINPLSTTV